VRSASKVLTVSLLTQLALAHAECGRDLLAVGEIAQAAAPVRHRSVERGLA
jgi:hypothetical protein